MNKIYTNQKLLFTVFASTVILMQDPNIAEGVKAKDGEILVMEEEILPKLVFDGSSIYENLPDFDIIKEENEEFQLQKKLEEEERIRIESLASHIFIDTNDLRILSDIKVEHLQGLLSGTDLEHLAQDFLDAQNTYQVNVLFLTALAANESGWGTSWLAVNKNNLTGYAAYPGQEKDAKYFNSKRESIMTTAELISEHYLNPEGKYHNGFGLKDVNKMYCQYADGTANYSWSDVIGRLMTDFASTLKVIANENKVDAEAVTYVYFNGQDV